jgi:hypothetical protein
MTLDRHMLWQKYLSCTRAGGTPEQRRAAFQAWWKLERADSFASTRADLSRGRRTKAKALSGG